MPKCQPETTHVVAELAIPERKKEGGGGREERKKEGGGGEGRKKELRRLLDPQQRPPTHVCNGCTRFLPAAIAGTNVIGSLYSQPRCIN